MRRYDITTLKKYPTATRLLYGMLLAILASCGQNERDSSLDRAENQSNGQSNFHQRSTPPSLTHITLGELRQGLKDPIWKNRHQDIVKKITKSATVNAAGASNTVNFTAPASQNGRIAQEGDAPWAVGLYEISLTQDGFDISSPICSGSIIASKWILTADHCVDQTIPEDVWVIVPGEDGSGNRSVNADSAIAYQLAGFIDHVEFSERNPEEYSQDIAALRLYADIPFRWRIKIQKNSTTQVYR